MQEYITEELIKLAWHNLGGNNNRLNINSKKIKIPIKDEYINKIKNQDVRTYIISNKNKYYYGLSVDKHVFIDNKFIIGIECKAYTENAMIKRILVDFHLLKTVFPQIKCFLFQLESQLGGDYSSLSNTIYGSKATHSIMSYFDDVDLEIITFLKGERDIKYPIHKNFKPLEVKTIENILSILENNLRKFL